MNPRYLLLALLAPLLLRAASDDGGEAQLARTTAELSANLLLARLEQQIITAPPDADPLRTAMTQNPDRFRLAAEARRDLLPVYTDTVKAAYAREAGSVLDQIAEKSGGPKVFAAPYRTAATAIPDAALGTVVAAHYTNLFQAARERVCREQADTLSKEIHPTETEIETVARDTLATQLTDRLAAAQKNPVFEENVTLLRDSVIGPLLDEAYRQRDRQKRIVEEARSPVAATPTDYAAFLSRTLEDAFAADRQSTTARIYAVFPSVQALLPTLGENRAKARYADFLSTQAKPLDETAVAALLDQKPADHRKTDASRRIVLARFVADNLTDIDTRYLADQPEAGRDALRRYLAARPIPEKEQKKLLEKTFSDCMEAVWKRVRQSRADAQFAACFSDLASGNWLPTDGQVEQADRDQLSGAMLEEVLRRSLRGPHEIADLMQETRSRAEKGFAAELRRGLQALKTQEGLVRSHEPDMRSWLTGQRQAKTGGAAALEREAVARYTGRVLDAWTAQRAGLLYAGVDPLPANNVRAYTALFPAIEEQIRLRIKEMLAQPVEPEKPQPPTPETPPEPILIDPLKLACRIDVEMNDREIAVRLTGDLTSDRFSCPIAYNDYLDKEKATVAAIVDAFRAQLVARSADRPVELALDIEVKNGMVYYRFISRLRERLRAELEKLNKERLRFQLSDRFE